MDIFWENTLMILEGLGASLYMTLFATLFAYILGLPLGVLTIITGRDSILPAPRLHSVLGWVINIGRSIPFIILMVALIPFTRFVVGRATGPTAAIVPLVVAAAPFVARMVETSLEEVDPGVVEAARTMGATTWQIIYKVFLPESVPSLIRGASITTITLIGYSAIAGAIGAGGLGDIAIRFGYYRYQDDIMIYTIVVLVVLVQIIQSVFNFTAKKIDKRSV
jgi:D-methionine transport system permease protein